MARAHFVTYLLDEEGRPIGGASVIVREPDTTTSISETIYAADTPSGVTKANPFIADADGRIEFFLANPKIVDLNVQKTGYNTRIVRAEVAQLTASTLVFKQAGSPLAQRAGVDFGPGFLLSDDAGNNDTDVALDWAETADIAPIGAASGAGSGNEVPFAGHIHSHPDTGSFLPNAHHNKLHIHDGVDGSGTVGHSVLTGVTANQHHSQAHGHDGADGSGTVAYSAITGKPASFVPSVHTHADAGNGGTVAYSAITGKPSTFAPSAHTHDYAADLTSVPTTFTPNAHKATKHTFVGFIGALASNLSVTNQTFWALSPSTEILDTDAIGVAGTTTVPAGQGGKWHVKARVKLPTPGSSYDVVMQIRVGGVVKVQEIDRANSAAGGAVGQECTIDATVIAVAGDDIAVEVWQNSGGSVSVQGDGTQSGGSWVELEYRGV